MVGAFQDLLGTVIHLSPAQWAMLTENIWDFNLPDEVWEACNNVLCVTDLIDVYWDQWGSFYWVM